MSQKPISGFFLHRVEARPLLSVFVAALALRWLLLALGFVDFWGDAHHNLIMSKLTLDNNWLYSDFKDRHLTWLPLYRYLGAFVMWVTGSYSLLVMNVVNTFIGAFTAVAGGWLGLKLGDKKAALWSGMGIAVMPYLLVFSYVSMAEMLGGLLLILWVIGVTKKQAWIIVTSAFLAALTRYELTFLIGISAILLWWMNERKSAVQTVAGLASALLLWSAWSVYQTGHPLNWLLMRIESTTRSTGFYAQDVNVFVRFGLLPLGTVLQAFPLVVFFIWFKGRPSVKRVFSPVFLMGFLTLAHLIFFFFAQTKVMVSPETRFFVISLPVTTTWFMLLLAKGYFRPFVRQRIVFIILGLSLLQLIVPFYRQYSLQPRREIGYWMAENLEPNTKVWSDLAVAVVESEKPPQDFYSSEVLIPTKKNDTESLQHFIHHLDSLDIEYVTSYPSPADFSSFLIPELNNYEPFEWQGISFVPVFVYQPYSMEKASIHSYLRYRFEEAASPASIWRIYRL